MKLLTKILVPVLSISSMLLTYSLPGSAAGPTRTPVNNTSTNSFSAGQYCNFNYTQTVTFEGTILAFGNPVTKTITNFTIVETHTNDDTGYTLTGTANFSEQTTGITEESNGVAKTVGSQILRDPSGKVVLVNAGQIKFNTSGGVIKATPNINPDFVALICTALGGAPAI